VKTGYAFLATPLLPLVIVIVLAIGGIMINQWVHVILAVICPVTAGIIWFMYKDMERKLKKSH